jgi:prevent-host-death family protein
MIRVPASEFQTAFGAISEMAESGPVTITKQGRDHLVVLPAEEYMRLKRRDRQASRTAVAEEHLGFMAAAEPNGVAEAFDHEAGQTAH